MKLYHGDCEDYLSWCVRDNSVDALVTDPPAGISFMGKDWDHHKGGRREWIAWMTGVMVECHRVMKPGAHGLVWALPRTSHWTATALEDAGFEIRDVVTHLFGTGFPKSLDVSKAIDKAAGAKRVLTGPKIYGGGHIASKLDPGGKTMAEGWQRPWQDDPAAMKRRVSNSDPATDAAKQWQGWGTALKPASEHWILIRKPCSEKTVAANVLKWGTGALNIDGGRITASKDYGRSAARSDGVVNKGEFFMGLASNKEAAEYASPLGRFPSHLLLDEEAGAMLDEQSGISKSPRTYVRSADGFGKSSYKAGEMAGKESLNFGDSGGASRFFYCAKISPGERGADNKHPTVKPQKLMRYLCRLVTPPNGLVLDPFMGSGSTGVAAVKESFGFMGIEQDEAYFKIAKCRIERT